MKISSRFPLEEFINKDNNQKVILDETNRIIREIHENYMNRVSMEECITSIESNLLTRKDIKILTLENTRKYITKR